MPSNEYGMAGIPITANSLLKGPPMEEERRAQIQLCKAPTVVYDSLTKHPFPDFVHT